MREYEKNEKLKQKVEIVCTLVRRTLTPTVPDFVVPDFVIQSIVEAIEEIVENAYLRGIEAERKGLVKL